MPKKFAVNTSSGVVLLTKVVREKVKLVIPMITAAFILIGGGKIFSESELVALAAQPAITVYVNSGSQNDGKMYSDNWSLDSNNSWEYYENGKKVTNSWIHDHNQWYLVGEDGKMRTGLYMSNGKYYLLDDVRGTGTYGKLLKNGSIYKGVKISADTSSDYEGALDEISLANLRAFGIKVEDAVNVSGTQHTGQAQVAKNNDVFNPANYSGYVPGTRSSDYRPIKLQKTDNRRGLPMVVGIYENGVLHAIGTDGKKYVAREEGLSGRARNWYNGDEFMASDWVKYLNTGKQAPDGRIYEYYDSNNDGVPDAIASVTVTFQDGTYVGFDGTGVPSWTADHILFWFKNSKYYSVESEDRR